MKPHPVPVLTEWDRPPVRDVPSKSDHVLRPADGRPGGTRAEEGRRLERQLAAILRGGVIVAAVLLALGLPGVMFTASGAETANLSVGAALGDLPSLDSESLVALGVLVLVATPILQLLTSLVLFWRKHDRLYLALTGAVCSIVAVGALLVGTGH